LDETAQAITVTFGGETYTYKAKPTNVMSPQISLVEVENSELFTNNTTISLNPTVTKAVASYYKISESTNFENADWKPFTTPIPFVVSSADGLKTVYLRVKNPIGESNIGSASIILKKMPEKLDASTRQHIRVSPNPIIAKANISLIDAENALTLNAINNLLFSLTILDFTGKTVYHKLVNTLNNEVDFSNFHTGFYVVSLRNETTNLNTKVLKQ
jgi:hypothetical protein